VPNENLSHFPTSPDAAMNPRHPRWDEFVDRMVGQEGCGFGFIRHNSAHYHCRGDHRSARHILAGMGFDEATVTASLAWFRRQRADCDCMILWKIAWHVYGDDAD
jgi:hypothetical protein